MLFHAADTFRVTCSDLTGFWLLAVWAPNVTKLHRPKRPGKTLYTDLIRKNPLWRIGFFIFTGRLRKYWSPDLMSVSKNKSFPGIRAICKLSVSLSKSDWCIYTMWHLSCPLIEFPITVHVLCIFHRFLHFSICTTWLKLVLRCRPSVTTRCSLITKETLFQIS